MINNKDKFANFIYFLINLITDLQPNFELNLQAKEILFKILTQKELGFNIIF